MCHVYDVSGRVVAIVLNRAAPLAGGVAAALGMLLARHSIAVTSGETPVSELAHDRAGRPVWVGRIPPGLAAAEPASAGGPA
jgi:hypothetical protein